MAGDARSGLKRAEVEAFLHAFTGLNGWGCPFGFETARRGPR